MNILKSAGRNPVPDLRYAGAAGRPSEGGSSRTRRPSISRRAAARPVHTTHFLLRFDAEPGPDIRRELERRGMRILQYVPDAALMVASPAHPEPGGLRRGYRLGGLEVSTTRSAPCSTARFRAPCWWSSTPTPRWRQSPPRSPPGGFEVVANPAMLPGQLVVNGPHTALATLAALDDVAYIMPASPELAAGVPMAGCAGASTEAGPVGEYVLMSRGWAKDAAGRVDLRYSIRNLTDQMPAATARAEIERAVREWTPLRRFHALGIQRSRGTSGAFDISFLRGSHGDGYPFDGAGRLAGAYVLSRPAQSRADRRRPAPGLRTRPGTPGLTSIFTPWCCTNSDTPSGWGIPTGRARSCIPTISSPPR